MTDKEKIRNIIELFIAWNGETDVIDVANIDSAVEFIASSLQEEPVSEELEDAAIEICSKILKGETVIIDGYEYIVLSDAEECFKAGAQWQKQQMKVVYVITRCEEHSDYVEEVFLDEDKAKEYCKQFEGNEDAYARHITKIEVTL